jgi:hypothetical protein
MKYYIGPRIWTKNLSCVGSPVDVGYFWNPFDVEVLLAFSDEMELA